jgi:hypothetical protein
MTVGQHRRNTAEMRAVCMDLAADYRSLVRLHFPNHASWPTASTSFAPSIITSWPVGETSTESGNRASSTTPSREALFFEVIRSGVGASCCATPGPHLVPEDEKEAAGEHEDHPRGLWYFWYWATNEGAYWGTSFKGLGEVQIKH